MARISVIGTPFEKALLNDIDKKQSLREHTINPPGQERYIRPVDLVALQKALDAHNSGAGTTEDASDVVASTIGIGFVSTTAIQAAVTEVLTAEELTAIQDLLSYRVAETGNFLLSFNNGVIKGMLDKGWIKVFNDEGSSLFQRPNPFDEWLDARLLTGGDGDPVSVMQGAYSNFSASQQVDAQRPKIEIIEGVKAVRFTVADSSFLDFDYPPLIEAHSDLGLKSVTYITAHADTGSNTDSGRMWVYGSDTLTGTAGLNLRQSTTGLAVFAQDDGSSLTIGNTFISSDGLSQRSISAVRINSNLTWDAWVNGVRTITAGTISTSLNGYDSYNRFTLGALRRPSSVHLFDDSAFYGFGVILNPNLQSDADVLQAMGIMNTVYKVY